jgi:transcriptional regulator of acetoin/glycerol metabolism
MESWTTYLTQLPRQHPVRRAIFESWSRSEKLGLDRTGSPSFRKINGSELQERLEKNRAFIEAASRHVPRLVKGLPGSSHVAYITDTDGIVLWSMGPPEQVGLFGLSPGHDWSERAMGTNGAGTCLQTLRPIVVAGDEHYQTAFHNCTCTAAPVLSGGRLIGALDVTSSVEDANYRRIEKVVEVAGAIASELGNTSRE